MTPRENSRVWNKWKSKVMKKKRIHEHLHRVDKCQVADYTAGSYFLFWLSYGCALMLKLLMDIERRCTRCKWKIWEKETWWRRKSRICDHLIEKYNKMCLWQEIFSFHCLLDWHVFFWFSSHKMHTSLNYRSFFFQRKTLILNEQHRKLTRD